MKRTAFVCSLILVMAMAVAAAAPGDQKGKTVPRDFWGVLNGGFTFVYFGSGDYDFDTLGAATGTLSPLGLVTLSTKHRPSAGGSLDGTFVIVAAGGDKIRGTYTGTVEWITYVPAQLTGTLVLEISGGTGRFAHASGSINASFLETPLNDNWYIPVPTTWALQGTISY
jgi:hypothetical protein